MENKHVNIIRLISKLNLIFFLRDMVLSFDKPTTNTNYYDNLLFTNWRKFKKKSRNEAYIRHLVRSRGKWKRKLHGILFNQNKVKCWFVLQKDQGSFIKNIVFLTKAILLIYFLRQSILLISSESKSLFGKSQAI